MTTEVTTRWLINNDIDAVLVIEEQNNQWLSWTKKDFLDSLRSKNVIGIIAESSDTVMGYVIYELYRNKIHIVKLEASHKGNELGASEILLTKLKSKLTPGRRRFLTIDVEESKVERQNLLKTHKFKAIKVKKAFFKVSDEDAYYFLLKLNEKDEFIEPKDLSYEDNFV